MDLSLKNKVAVVCGSTQGIGKASAVELARLGASVVLVARNEEKLIQTSIELVNNDNSGKQMALKLRDFAIPNAAELIVNEIEKCML